MKASFLESLTHTLELELPVFDKMDDYLDFILREIRPMSEDLHEFYFVNKRWLEFRDHEHFHESILHIFQRSGEGTSGEYLISLNGNITKGAWRLMGGGVILEHTVVSELYDLAFSSDTFFILKKHGQQPPGRSKYLVMGLEGRTRALQWRDLMELLFNSYRENSRFKLYLALVLIVVLVLVLLSIF